MKLRIIGIALVVAAIVFSITYGSMYFIEYSHRSGANVAKLEEEAKLIEAEAKIRYFEESSNNDVEPISDEEEVPLESKKIRIVDNDVVCKLTLKACNIETLVYENEEDDYYLRRDANGKESRHGEVYTNCYDCDVPIIFGHHMSDGTMFAGLDCCYIGAEITLEDIGYLEDEIRTYKVTEVEKDIPAYKVWDYLDQTDGDLVLVTCSYGVDNGRLVVIAKEERLAE